MSDPEIGRAGTLHAAPDRDGDDAPAFKVIDRRRFAADGSERAEDAEPAPASTPPPQSGAPQNAASSAPPVTPAAAAADAAPELAMPHGEPYEERPSAPFEPSFGTLLISLSTQALMHLGEIPDLEGGEARRDLAAARHIIDLIAVLERKTQGNLDADEAALLERILYDLRMRFVAISRG
jgi:hypothetical protein